MAFKKHLFMGVAFYIVISAFFYPVLGSTAPAAVVTGDVFKDPFLLMDNDFYYIWDRAERRIVIYKRKPFGKMAQCVRRGQGPGEFIALGGVTLTPDWLVVSGYPKVAFFRKNGEYVREVKSTGHCGGFIPLGDRFVGVCYPPNAPGRGAPIQYQLFSSRLEVQKEIFTAWGGQIPPSKDPGKQNILLFPPCTRAMVEDQNKDRRPFLYIATDDPIKGQLLSVFDSDGKLVRIIKPRSVKREVTAAEQTEYLLQMKESMTRSLGENEWRKMQAMFHYVFPAYYPSFSSFSVSCDRVYFFGYPEKGRLTVEAYDLEGRFLYRKELPKEIPPDGVLANRYAIRWTRLFYLVENDAEECWEIRSADLAR